MKKRLIDSGSTLNLDPGLRYRGPISRSHSFNCAVRGKTLLMCVAVIAIAQFAGGCALIWPHKEYTGYEAYGQAHPDMVQPMPYMDPDHNYQADDK